MINNFVKLLAVILILNSQITFGQIKKVKLMEDKLIKREILFGNPEKVEVQISPDGSYLSYIAPNKGVLNVWITPIDDIFNAKLITSDKKRGIRNYFWSKDSQYIIYAQDKAGDENWRLYSVNINSLIEKSLTHNNVRASILKLSKKFPKEILILLNARVPEYFDIHKVNIETGKIEIIYTNTEKYSYFIADDDFKIRVGK